MEQRQAKLLSQLAEEAERLSALDQMAGNRFRLTVRNRSACGNSSTLQLPVQLFVPLEYTTSPAALTGRFVQWLIHRVTDEDNENEDQTNNDRWRPTQTLLWEGEAIPLQRLCLERDHLEVDTTLICATISHWLMRVKLVDAKSQAVLASTFFNPSSLISKGHINFGPDTRNAWQHFRLLNQSNP